MLDLGVGFFDKLKVVKISDLKVPSPMLRGTEALARAAHFKIEFGKFKAVVNCLKRLYPRSVSKDQTI